MGWMKARTNNDFSFPTEMFSIGRIGDREKKSTNTRHPFLVGITQRRERKLHHQSKSIASNGRGPTTRPS